jgi:hypothetical protein
MAVEMSSERKLISPTSLPVLRRATILPSSLGRAWAEPAPKRRQDHAEPVGARLARLSRKA